MEPSASPQLPLSPQSAGPHPLANAILHYYSQLCPQRRLSSVCLWSTPPATMYLWATVPYFPAGTQSFRGGQSNSTTKTKGGRTICLCYNTSTCPNCQKCKFAHVCLKCDGDHPQSSTPSRPTLVDEPPKRHHPNTLIDMAQLKSELSKHPDQMWCSHLLHRLQHGATIGYQGPRTAQTTPNLISASLHPDIATRELQQECTKCQIAGPYHSSLLEKLQCSGPQVLPAASSAA